MPEIPFLVLSEGYHGHGDEWVSLTPPSCGVPQNFASIRPLRPDFTESEIEEADAVILEPVMTDWSDQRRNWLQRLRELCTKHDTVLIFDEVVTGFRWPKYSVSNYWDITPDLIVLGKAIAGGMPLAAVGGKYAVMNKSEYFISSTYAGETLSLVAAKTVMTLLQTKYDLNQLWERGQAFISQFNAIWEAIQIEGYPTRGVFKGEAETKAMFFQECCEAGILFGPSFFYNFPLSEEAHGVLQVCRDVMTRIRLGQVTLRGQLPQSPFAEKVRQQS